MSHQGNRHRRGKAGFRRGTSWEMLQLQNNTYRQKLCPFGPKHGQQAFSEKNNTKAPVGMVFTQGKGVAMPSGPQHLC